MKQKTSAENARLEMVRLCHSGLDARTLRIELLKLLQAAIPFDYVYFSTTDPATQLGTSSVLIDEPPPWMMSVFVENEFLHEDFNKFSTMLRQRQLVAALGETARGDLRRSRRYQDMLAPLAMRDELRAIFVTDGACWGTLCLHRGQAELEYTPVDTAYLAQLVPHIAEGLRKGLLLGGSPSTRTPGGPGVLILADDLSIVAMTADAEHWLMALTEMEGGDRHALPLAVRSVVIGLKALERGVAAVNFTPKVRLRMQSGQWLVIYASRLRNADGQGQISVILEAAQPAEITPLIMQAYDLTRREGEITQCVLLGWTTNEISARLYISPNTVQDHLKAIFEKVDVSSRGELAARIFTRQYQPQFLAGAPLDTSGQLTTPD